MTRTQPRLAPLTPGTARGAARDMLAGLVARHGQVGPMVRTMAHSPAVLGGYLDLSRAIKRAKPGRRVSERISLAIQQHQDCALCLAARTGAAHAVGVDEDEIERVRQGASADPAIAAAIAFALRVHTAPATITGQHVAELRQHGYSDREIADIVGLVALNVLTGAFNLVVGLEPKRPSRARLRIRTADVVDTSVSRRRDRSLHLDVIRAGHRPSESAWCPARRRARRTHHRKRW